MCPQRLDEWPWALESMSLRERILFQEELDLFMCPKTFVKCPYCGIYDTHERMCAHKNACKDLPDRERQIVRTFNKIVETGVFQTREERNRLYSEAMETIEWRISQGRNEEVALASDADSHDSDEVLQNRRFVFPWEN